MTRILSTKILAPRQRSLVESHGFEYQDYNAIEISFQKFELDLSSMAYIFTSQNAVRGFLRILDDLPLPEKRKEALSKPCFCVGRKTGALLEENGLKVLKMSKNSRELAEFLAKNHQNTSFLFICGNRRRDDLPRILQESSITFKEAIAYHTLDNSQKLKHRFDGILFFSPSAVQSFSKLNSMEESTAFCIGDTTAGEAARHSSEVVVSPRQSIESVLEVAVDYYLKRS